MKELLKPKSVIAERIAARKSVATHKADGGYQKVVVTKGMRYRKEEKLASESLDEKELNPDIGFRCLHYSASEACGHLEVVVLKKKKGPVKVGVRTRDGTATGVKSLDEIPPGVNPDFVHVD